MSRVHGGALLVSRNIYGQNREQEGKEKQKKKREKERKKERERRRERNRRAKREEKRKTLSSSSVLLSFRLPSCATMVYTGSCFKSRHSASADRSEYFVTALETPATSYPRCGVAFYTGLSQGFIKFSVKTALMLLLLLSWLGSFLNPPPPVPQRASSLVRGRSATLDFVVRVQPCLYPSHRPTFIPCLSLAFTIDSLPPFDPPTRR